MSRYPITLHDINDAQDRYNNARRSLDVVLKVAGDKPDVIKSLKEDIDRAWSELRAIEDQYYDQCYDQFENSQKVY